MFRSAFALLLLAHLQTFPQLSPAPPFFEPSSLLEVHPAPSRAPSALQEPWVEAKAALLMDRASGALLYRKNVDEALPMASLTKIMTAVVILESHALDELVSVQEDYSGLEGAKMGLRKGERMAVGDLLIGLLVRSAGDAAMALALHHSGSEASFAKAMNRKAELLGLSRSRFLNPVGLDAEGHQASAWDLALLTKYALGFPAFREIVSLRQAIVLSSDGSTQHALQSTNLLLNSDLDIRGVKTGTTDAAGESVINLVRHKDGHEIISVLLNSPDRFQESRAMIEWALGSTRW